MPKVETARDGRRFVGVASAQVWVCVETGEALVFGDPREVEPDDCQDDDPLAHSCDAAGCSSVSHRIAVGHIAGRPDETVSRLQGEVGRLERRSMTAQGCYECGEDVGMSEHVSPSRSGSCMGHAPRIRAERDAALAEVERLRRATAPVQGYGPIPWELHERAWHVYAAKHGRYQSATRIAERGGFGVSEMDEFLPGWRDEASAESRCQRLEAEVARLRERNEDMSAVLGEFITVVVAFRRKYTLPDFVGPMKRAEALLSKGDDNGK